MKKFGKIAVYCSIGLITFSISACSETTQDATESADVVISEADLFIADYSVEGMVCAMGCAKTIQDEVADMAGIAACEVDFESGKAHIEFDQTQVKEGDIIAAIEGMADGQYKVSKWEDKAEEETIEESQEELEVSEESEETTSEVSLPNFEIPNLFKLLFNQL